MNDNRSLTNHRSGLALRVAMIATILPLTAVMNSSCQAQKEPAPKEPAASVVTFGNGSDAIRVEMPRDLSWRTAIASPSEPGERLEITGVVYRPDGTTPAPDVVLYLYHTGINGYYSPAPDDSSRNRHGHLRGWLKTNERGEYAFTSIRPAPYPRGIDPAHIHMYVKEPARDPYYIDDYYFADDTLVTSGVRERLEGRGGSGIVKLTRGSDGVWRGMRDIILGRNIPDYR